LSQRTATSARPLPQYERKILQMLAGMKNQMKEQQAWSDHDQEQVAPDHENVVRE